MNGYASKKEAEKAAKRIGAPGVYESLNGWWPCKDLEVETIFTLTKRDVNKSERGEPDTCMVANCIQREGKGYAEVISKFIYFQEDPRKRCLSKGRIDDATRAKIETFDTAEIEQGRLAEILAGTSIIVRVPSPSQRVNYKAGKSGTNVRGTGRGVSRKKARKALRDIHKIRKTRKAS